MHRGGPTSGLRATCMSRPPAEEAPANKLHRRVYLRVGSQPARQHADSSSTFSEPRHRKHTCSRAARHGREVAMLALVLSCLATPFPAVAWTKSSPVKTVSALLPAHSTSADDPYVCASVPLPSDSMHLVRIQPAVAGSAAVNMMLYGAHLCPELLAPSLSWT